MKHVAAINQSGHPVMLQRRVTRIGVLFAFVGLAVLGASSFHWSHTTSSRGFLYSNDEYEWVKSSTSSKPAISRDEVWDLPAACVKQFYLGHINDLKAQLAAHNSTKPPPVVLKPPKKDIYATTPEMQRSAESFDRLKQKSDRESDAIKEIGKLYGTISIAEYQALLDALEQNDLAIDPTWFAI
jgi:hypothetical protein